MIESVHPYQPIQFFNDEAPYIKIIDQRELPFKVVFKRINSSEDAVLAIKEMWLRGAPLIGITAAYALVLATYEAKLKNEKSIIDTAAHHLLEARPTAINLKWAIDKFFLAIKNCSSFDETYMLAIENANEIAKEEYLSCYKIGLHGLEIIKNISAAKNGKPVQILTHCNAGWLACGQWGTALSPIYLAREIGIEIHVWVDETRPRNQGMLTAWELGQQGIPHTIITDNAGGFLMQSNKVDMCITGTDRTFANGSVINKIGTYLKALAAFDNDIPFYAALPFSSIDWETNPDEIIIEYRHPDEIHYIKGETGDNQYTIRLSPEKSEAINPAFDITPPKLVTGFITEAGLIHPGDLYKLNPEIINKKNHFSYAKS